MASTERSLRNISDTALWAAVFRARETDKGDALFRDPFARALAGERGETIINTMPHADENAWAWIMRTYLFDQAIAKDIEHGGDMVVNVAAGLDARPYRMALPQSLQWIEIDLPELFAYKEPILSAEKPVCALERIPFDLADVGARRELFSTLGRRAAKALVISEGLLIYLSAEEVGSLAKDLSATDGFRYWVLELASPGLLQMLQQTIGKGTSEVGAPLKFGPPEGPGFFAPYGWEPIEIQSVLQAAIATKRLPSELEPFASIPESSGPQGSQPWSGVCTFSNKFRASESQ
jgi:methyltransferase (TIGR00027 family)